MVTLQAKSSHRGLILRTLADYPPMKTRTLYASPTGPDHATVRDILAGSNITGSAAGKLDRRWLRFEKGCAHPVASAFRFVDELLAEELTTHWNRLHADDLLVELNRQQRELVLGEKANSVCPAEPAPSIASYF